MPTTAPRRASRSWRGEILGLMPRFFEVERYRVTVERRMDAKGAMVTASEAVVVARFGPERVMSVSESHDPVTHADQGPVNALSRALRKDLGPYQAFIDDMKLVDFRVRITSGGTEAVTRVLIESADGQGRRWSTVGVSANIVDASFQALQDAITWKLLARRRAGGGRRLDGPAVLGAPFRPRPRGAGECCGHPPRAGARRHRGAGAGARHRQRPGRGEPRPARRAARGAGDGDRPPRAVPRRRPRPAWRRRGTRRGSAPSPPTWRRCPLRRKASISSGARGPPTSSACPRRWRRGGRCWRRAGGSRSPRRSG